MKANGHAPNTNISGAKRKPAANTSTKAKPKRLRPLPEQVNSTAFKESGVVGVLASVTKGPLGFI